MARMLMISDEIEAALKALAAKAAERPTSFETLQKMSGPGAADIENIGNNDLTMTVPRGYRVTYTEEYQKPDVRCRHLSVSLIDGKPNTGPHPEAVTEIMRMIGFKNNVHQCAVYIGTIKRGLVINVVEPMSGDMNELAEKPHG